MGRTGSPPGACRTGARDEASNGTSARNQLVATFILGLILLLVLFAMQLQTFCDPLVALLPRSVGWTTTKDFRVCRHTLLLTLASRHAAAGTRSTRRRCGRSACR